MRSLALVTVTLLAGVFAACDNRNGNQTPPTAATEPAAEKLDDGAFVEKAAVAGLFEVETSQLALQRATKPELKELAQAIVTDRTTANNELKDVIGSGRVPDVTHVPSALDAEHQAKLEALKAAANGPAFDERYRKLQLEGHKQAVAMFEKQSKAGDNPNLKDWATKTLPKLKEHLGRIESITL